jgi:hypothetical protein
MITSLHKSIHLEKIHPDCVVDAIVLICPGGRVPGFICL